LTVWTTTPLVVGHRGGRGEGWPPENTIEAFERARSAGARAVELDVRTCADGEPVVFHDDTLARMTEGRDVRDVHEMNVAELCSVDLGGGTFVPTFADVLSWARASGTAVNVEMKYDRGRRVEVARATVRKVRACAGVDILLSSFDPLLLAMAAAMAPSVPRALLTHAGQTLAAGVVQKMARPSLVRAIHLEAKQADVATVAGLTRRGLRVGAWTVNDPSQARNLIRRGVSSIITDAPDVLLATFSERAATRG
jgi:glycerophosphoryl diester phosphodiesterase